MIDNSRLLEEAEALAWPAALPPEDAQQRHYVILYYS